MAVQSLRGTAEQMLRAGLGVEDYVVRVCSEGASEKVRDDARALFRRTQRDLRRENEYADLGRMER
jgi:hypothetical protein